MGNFIMIDNETGDELNPYTLSKTRRNLHIRRGQFIYVNVVILRNN